MPKSRDYCCCAIPLVNAGIYLALIEQFVLGLVAGIAAIATPHIVGAATFSAAKWVFAIVCWVGAALQLMGFLAVTRSQLGTFLLYAQLHGFATVAAFSVAAVWIILSATRHNTAVSQCLSDFFPGSSTSEGETMCKIFPWADVGIMGGLWLLLAIAQLYLLSVVRSYNKSAGAAGHRRLNSDFDLSATAAGGIAMQSRAPAEDTWDASDPVDRHSRALERGAYGHVRGGSVGAEKYAPRSPEGAYTQEPEPTPAHYQTAYGAGNGGYTSGAAYPEAIQPHPAEGSFGRKIPRQRTTGEQYDDPYYRQ